ncbi:hypothetical protein ASPCAL00332 [Aspergillus calidoustus]|uniref:Alpha-ketoglutarate-dependent dioxygenase AlkB-like domain-containing protein n=1 Tax=Aspergillus calidoustus TaxID=454130 RepID=A0A0U5FMU0_ASPCI|nr:hypothetical protein ASPCAL00332 [Aspergillus calidoustus]
MDTHPDTDSRNNLTELPISPSGILWQNDFITPDHEQRLISIFQTELTWPERNGRLSLHYGYTFDYKTFGIDPDIPYKEFPEWLQPLIPTSESRPPDQVCLQYYPPGAGIPPHVDSHRAWDQLYALSLGAPVLMALKKGKGKAKEEQQRAEIDLLPRSMMKLGGEGECECGDTELCDTAQARLGTEKEKRSVLAAAAGAESDLKSGSESPSGFQAQEAAEYGR